VLVEESEIEKEIIWLELMDHEDIEKETFELIKRNLMEETECFSNII
jgi:hypothetical protein